MDDPRPVTPEQAYMPQLRPQRRYGPINVAWIVLCLVAVTFVVGSGVHWSISHPFGAGYDETKYFIQVNYDRQRLANDGIWLYLRAFVTDDSIRPPAYRLMVAPVTWVLDPNPAVLRLTGIAWFVVALGFVFGIGHRFGGLTGGALVTTLVAICPIIAGPAFRFGTETPLLLGIAMSLYFLVRAWNNPRPDTRGWIGLGVGLGIGVLAKTSFATVMVPIMAAAVVLRALHWVKGPPIGWLIRAGVLGFALGIWWYGFNALETARHIRRAQQFTRHEIAALSEYSYIMLNEVYAAPLFVLIVLALAWALWRSRRLLGDLRGRPTLLVVGMLFLSVVPLQIAHQLLSNNQNPRFLAPATLLLLIAVGLLLTRSRATHRRATLAVVCSLIAVQLVVLGAPSVSMEQPLVDKRPVYDRPLYFNSRFPQWDWAVLTEYCHERGLEVNRVGLLGLGLPLSRPQIQYPWVRAGHRLRVDRLWQHTDGPFDMEAVMSAARQAPVVVTVPGYRGAHYDRNPADNVHNAEFSRRMREEGRYEQITDLPIDPAGEWTVHVFMRRDSAALSAGDGAGEP